MTLAVSIAARCAYAILSILWLMLLLEAIFSWIDSLRDHPIYEFLQRMTEPFVAPMRALLRKFAFFKDLPLDLSHLFTMLLITLLQSLLQSFM